MWMTCVSVSPIFSHSARADVAPAASRKRRETFKLVRVFMRYNFELDVPWKMVNPYTYRYKFAPMDICICVDISSCI